MSEALYELLVSRGIPARIRSDNAPEFVADALPDWIAIVRANIAYIEPVSPRENSYCESFNGKPCNELLNSEIFYTLKEAQICSPSGSLRPIEGPFEERVSGSS